jgi:hypothetical protein
VGHHKNESRASHLAFVGETTIMKASKQKQKNKKRDTNRKHVIIAGILQVQKKSPVQQ